MLPRVLVNRTYYATRDRVRPATPRRRASSPIASPTANWLAKSLDQRAQTILKVAAEIVKQQDGFLVHGITHLRPMTLKMVADAIEMHESTVSRVTSNKYVLDAAWPVRDEVLFHHRARLIDRRGRSLGRSRAPPHQADHRRRVRRPDILSDDTIAEMLQKEQGIEVARRTVAKYREGMNIPPR